VSDLLGCRADADQAPDAPVPGIQQWDGELQRGRATSPEASRPFALSCLARAPTKGAARPRILYLGCSEWWFWAAGWWLQVDLDVLGGDEFRACAAADDPSMPPGSAGSS
jgi:hypothetical protein